MIVAIVPAAGLSTRMGRPKLVLEIDGVPVIARVVRALLGGGADEVVVVCPPPEQEASGQIREGAIRAGATALVLSRPTADMRSTIEHGLKEVFGRRVAADVILIAPADAIGMNPEVVSTVIRQVSADFSRIVVPVRGGKKAHPLALPRSIAAAISTLPDGVGVNAIIAQFAGFVDLLPIATPGEDFDLDTPADYARLTQS